MSAEWIELTMEDGRQCSFRASAIWSFIALGSNEQDRLIRLPGAAVRANSFIYAGTEVINVAETVDQIKMLLGIIR
jgi:hypothetical protein